MNDLLLVGIAVYVVLNVISFLSYGWDKHKAKAGKWRTRESTLLIMGLLGPWGAVAGMKAFHHKTLKGKFKLNYFFLIFHFLIIALMIVNSH